MKISSAVTEYGGGHAWLHTGLPIPESARLIVEREAEKNSFLGPQGWQSQPVDIETLPSTRSGALLLGPNIVDHLKDGDYVTIRIAGTGFEESDFWPAVPMSGRKAKDNSGMIGAEAAKPSPTSSLSARPAASSKPISAPQQPIEEAGFQPREDVVYPPPKERSGRPFIFAAIALGLVLVVGAAYLLWRSIPEGTVASLSDRITTATSDLSASILGETKDSSYWTNVLRDQSATADAHYNAAVETRDDAEMQGLSHELLYQAASRGSTQAQRDYARLYDPTVTEPTGWQAQKNPRTALEFYSKILESGDQNATADVTRVCDFLKPNVFNNAGSRTAFDDYCSQ